MKQQYVVKEVKMLLNYDRIRLAMARKAYGIPELASAYGVSKQRMNVIVNSRNVTTRTAGKLAKVLDVDVTEIID